MMLKQDLTSPGNLVMLVAGVALIVFASSCFTNVPFLGTVFLVPGDNILNAKLADPMLRYALFLLEGHSPPSGYSARAITAQCAADDRP